MKTLLAFFLFSLSIGYSEIKHDFLAVDNGKNRLFRVDQIGGKSWSVAIPGGARDLQIIPGNKVLLSHGSGANEYDLETGKQSSWSVTKFKDIQTARRLANGNTLIGSNQGGITFTEINSSGETVRSVNYLGLGDLRIARVLESGNLLFTGSSPHQVFEGDFSKKIVWKATLPGKGYKAWRLPNGNTWATTGETVTVIEIDKQGKVVKTLGGNSNVGQKWYSGFHLLENGNIVVANWLGHGQEGKGPHAVEFDSSNKLVWSWEDHTLASTITNLLVLDSPSSETKLAETSNINRQFNLKNEKHDVDMFSNWNLNHFAAIPIKNKNTWVLVSGVLIR